MFINNYTEEMLIELEEMNVVENFEEKILKWDGENIEKFCSEIHVLEFEAAHYVSKYQMHGSTPEFPELEEDYYSIDFRESILTGYIEDWLIETTKEQNYMVHTKRCEEKTTHLNKLWNMYH